MSKVIWLDAQLSPVMAEWICSKFDIACNHVGKLGLKNSADREIFFEARKSNAIVITKDSDFLDLLLEHGSPPKVIWLTCGNTSNARLQLIFMEKLSEALKILEGSNDLVEITEA